MGSAGICARCGRPLKKREHIGALCLNCYLETHKLLCVPERLSFDYCKYCGSIRYGHKWIPGGGLEEASAKYVELVASSAKPCLDTVESYRLVSVRPLTVASWRTVYRVEYAVKLCGVNREVVQGYTVVCMARPTVCPACKRARSGDYNVLVQIRGASPARIARALEPLMNTDDHVVSSIIDIVEKRNGADLLLSDRGAASRIIKELRKSFGVKVRLSGEDVGTTSRGSMRRRLVYSVRLREAVRSG